MQVTLCGPASDKIYVPKIAVLEDGSKVTESGEAIDVDIPMEILDPPAHIPDGHWFAVLDKVIEVFPAGKSKEWAAKKASEMLVAAMVPNGDPLGRLASINSAATLIGVPVPDLLMALSRFNGKSNSLYESFVQMMENGGRIV